VRFTGGAVPRGNREGAGVVLTRTADSVLWQDGDEPPDRYTWPVALAFLRAFAR
jgi:hypothetical protein